MSSKTRSPTRGRQGGTNLSRALVPRFVKGGDEGSDKIVALLQQIAELRYQGVQRFEELDPHEQKKWIGFSDSVVRAQHHLSKLTKVLEEAVEKELDADLRLLQARIDDLEKRRKATLRIKNKNQKRREEREDAEAGQETAMFREDLADREQAREHRQGTHDQGIKERETQRKLRRARDAVLIGITVFCVLLAAFLIIFGVVHDKFIFIGGSGVSAAIAIGGFAKLIFGWGEPPPPTDTDD